MANPLSNLSDGSWHTMEVLFGPESSPGAGNGTYLGWVDGNQIASYNNVLWLAPGNNVGWSLTLAVRPGVRRCQKQPHPTLCTGTSRRVVREHAINRRGCGTGVKLAREAREGRPVDVGDDPHGIREVTVATIVGVLLVPVALGWALPLLSELLSLGSAVRRRHAAVASLGTPSTAGRQRVLTLCRPTMRRCSSTRVCIRCSNCARRAQSQRSS